VILIVTLLAAFVAAALSIDAAGGRRRAVPVPVRAGRTNRRSAR
jgi:hypothetical protein